MSTTEITKAYGTNCTKSGLVTHFQRDIIPNVNLIRDALAHGDDPKDLALIEGGSNWQEGHWSATSMLSTTHLHVFFMSKLSEYSGIELHVDQHHRDHEILQKRPHQGLSCESSDS